jgi:hypothetical protein
MARTLDCGGQHSLMMSATAGYPPRDNFSAFRDKTPQQSLVTIVNLLDTILAKSTMTFSSFIHNILNLSHG